MRCNLFRNSGNNLLLLVLLFLQFTAKAVNVNGKTGPFGSSTYLNKHFGEKHLTKNYTSPTKLAENFRSLMFLNNTGIDNELRKNSRKILARESNSDEIRKRKRPNNLKIKEDELTRPGYQNENTKPEKSPFAVVIWTIFHKKFKKLAKPIELSDYSVGALIHKSWVLTSASRLISQPDNKRGKVTVFAGNTTLENYQRSADQEREVDTIFIHPKFQGAGKNLDARFDFALIKLKDGFDMTTSVSFVELSPKRWPYEGYRKCKVTGFGKVFERNVSKDDDARKTHTLNLTRFNDSSCPNPNPENPYLLTELRDGFGLCTADYGAPLVCEGQVRGVFSNIYSKGHLDSCFNGEVNSTTYDCGSNKTYSMFQDTCACVHFVNEKVNLFLEDDIEDCKEKVEKPPTSGLPKKSLPILLIISGLVFRPTAMSC